MSTFSLPNWIKPHLFLNKRFIDLSEAEINTLKERLSFLRHDNPEVTVAIPAWNEENNIYRTLSSLSESKTNYKVEIIVINNNSSDKTQLVLDKLGVRTSSNPYRARTMQDRWGLTKREERFTCAQTPILFIRPTGLI